MCVDLWSSVWPVVELDIGVRGRLSFSHSITRITCVALLIINIVNVILILLHDNAKKKITNGP